MPASSQRTGRPVRLLDVGACGTLFDQFADIDDVAIDLCPQAGNGRVLQCDFLGLTVGDATTSRMEVAPDARFAGGALRALPAASFEAVALSLVLSYLPEPQLRGAMVRKARELLPSPQSTVASALHELADDADAERGSSGRSSEAVSTPGEGAAPPLRRGLLLIVDTFSVDRKAATRKGGYLKQWIDAIEAEGFVFLRHQVLMRSHALAFATAHLSAAELAVLRTRAPPELRMRREEVGEWDEGVATHAWGTATEDDAAGDEQ